MRPTTLSSSKHVEIGWLLWGARLHNTEESSTKSDDRKIGDRASSLSQASSAATVWTLESDLISKIQEANIRRKEDTETTKRALQKIEERVMEQYTDVTKRLKDHATGLVLLHEGNMHLEHNIKMLMTKMGVTPSNALPSNPVSEGVPAGETDVTKEVKQVKKVGRDLDGDFKMTAEEFVNVIEDCSRARETRSSTESKK